MLIYESHVFELRVETKFEVGDAWTDSNPDFFDASILLYWLSTQKKNNKKTKKQNKTARISILTS